MTTRNCCSHFCQNQKTPATMGTTQIQCPWCLNITRRKIKKHLRPTYMLSHYKHSRDSDKRDAKTKAPAAYIMSFTCSHIDQHSCDSDEKAPDRHKTKDLTTTATPAAATRPTTSEQYFVHATGARPHQLNADTPIFDFSGTDQVITIPDPRSVCVSQCMRHGRIKQTMIFFVGASYCGQESDVRSHAYI